jgi:hypothetical protein
MIINSSQNTRYLHKESRGNSRLKKDLGFATSAKVGRRCWARTGPGIWGTFTMISKAFVMWIGVTKERRSWCSTSRWGTIPISSVNNKDLGPSSREINRRTLCVLDVKNTSENEIFLNWKMSKQEASNSVGYVPLARIGCVRGISSSPKRILLSSRRIMATCKSKSTYLSLV